MNRPRLTAHPHSMGELSHLGGRMLVIFDGSCGFCNRAVRWALVRDRGDHLRFAAFGSPRIEDLLSHHRLQIAAEERNPSTVMVVCDPGGAEETLHRRSNAVVALLKGLPWPWPAVSAVLRVIPRPLRDFGYRLFAARRHRLGGSLAQCPLPTAAERARFL